MASCPTATKCNACGLPPRDPTKPLLQCTRCKGAHYHDTNCQRAHYPIHKAGCRRATAATLAMAKARLSSSLPRTTPAFSLSSSLVECRFDKAKGRSLFATKVLPIGRHPFAPTTKVDDDGGLCESIVHPVLLEQWREFRCSFCFRTIPDNNTIINGSSSVFHSVNAVLHRHCTHECRNLDKNWELEERAARTLPSPPSSTVLSCSRLIRQFAHFPSSIEEFNALSPGAEWIPSLPSTDEKVNDLAILMIKCKLFLKAMGDDQSANHAHNRFIPDISTSSQFIRRLHTNGFTISDAEQNHIGMGLFMKASVINHACRPNAIQTFWLRPQKPPMMQLTTVMDIKAGEEITISYCDASTPRLDRRRILWQDYNFICDCRFCQDINRDDDVYGLYCPKESCSQKGGRIRSTRGQNMMLDDYTCELCGQNRCDEETRALKQRFLGINESCDLIEGAIDVEREAYRRMRYTCRVDTSYFYALCAKQFVSTICNALPQITDEGERIDLIREALDAMNESRSASKFCFDFPGSLQWLLHWGEEAKLRLYANPFDTEAWNMLKDTRSKMLQYYPPCDETLLSLDESIDSYSKIGSNNEHH